MAVKYTTYAAEQSAKALRALAETNGVVPASTAADLAEDLLEARRLIEALICVVEDMGDCPFCVLAFRGPHDVRHEHDCPITPFLGILPETER